MPRYHIHDRSVRRSQLAPRTRHIRGGATRYVRVYTGPDGDSRVGEVVSAARALDELAAPRGNRLEALKGDRTGRYSIRVNDQYRIVFRFEDGAANDVTCEDYH